MPLRCSFCSSPRLMGGMWPARSPGNVLRETGEVCEEHRTRNTEFLDHTSTLNQEGAEAICDEPIDTGWDMH